MLDIFTDDPEWSAWSAAALASTGDDGALIVNPVIYAEVSTHFSHVEELDAALPPELFSRKPIPWDAAFLAGRCFLEYRRRGGTRRSPLPGFFIGAHAAVAGLRLLTRDRSRYETYLPTVPLITP